MSHVRRTTLALFYFYFIFIYLFIYFFIVFLVTSPEQMSEPISSGLNVLLVV